MRSKHVPSPRKGETQKSSVPAESVSDSAYAAKLAAAIKHLEASGTPRRTWPMVLALAGFRDVQLRG